MSRRSNSQIPFFHFAILLFTLLLIAYMVFLICLSTLSPRTFPSTSPSPSPAYLTDLSHSNALALAQSEIAAYSSNILNSVIDRTPTYHLLTTYRIAPSRTLPDPSLVTYLAHNDPITTQELLSYISCLSELLASGVIDSATLTLTPNKP